MIRYLIIGLMGFATINLDAQDLYDQYYMMGVRNGLASFSNPDTVIITYPISGALGSIATLAFICNKTGSPQFFTNGAMIGNLKGNTLLSTGMLDYQVEQDYPWGLPIPQGAIILPKNDCQYYCIYFSISDSSYNLNIDLPDRIYYALVDMCADSGTGVVLSTKNIIYHGVMGNSRMTACKHANGRDWWLVTHGYDDSTYFKFLITPDTITGPDVQIIGTAEHQPDQYSQAVFSSDGSKYASITNLSPLVVLDFDRCTGEFSNPKSISVPYYPPFHYNNTSGGDGCAFSADGRFIYVTGLNQIVQFDLGADSIDQSVALIAQYDSTYEAQYPFSLAHLAPNGKIYIENYDGSPKCYHVINNPDSAGAKCKYDKFGLCTDSIGAYPISNMPNYRLGPLSGSSCDTITSVPAISGVNNFRYETRLNNNPAHTTTQLVYVFKQNEDGWLKISDAMGQQLLYQYLPANNQKATVNVEQFIASTYIVDVHSRTGFNKPEKLVIIR